MFSFGLLVSIFNEIQILILTQLSLFSSVTAVTVLFHWHRGVKVSELVAQQSR